MLNVVWGGYSLPNKAAEIKQLS
ncbi:uncharacterized protein METZ01_LOCUS12077 [marine metagenome]|uniref:Uncharacterized protein n=1 Tax=marine metagenome TaxID=408172 RepID=A0A381P0L8_9ZZZZ